MGKKPLRALIIEDSEDDSLLMLRELRRGEYDVVHKRVETPESMREALAEKPWDVIISDYVLPKFSGLAALTILKESGQDLPFIIVSGNIGEDIAVGAMRAGAHDYIIKGNLTRLVPAVERELRDAESRRERRHAEEQLLQSRRKLLTTLENMNEGFFTLDQEWRLTYVNAEAARLWKKNPDEILGRTFWDVVPNAVGTIFETEYWRAVERQVPVWFETISPVLETWVEVRAYPSADGLAVYFHDITERKRSEELISRLNRLYSVLSKVNETIVRTRDPKELYDKVCRIAVENGAFRMAWIGMTDPGTRRVVPVASAGDDGGYLADLAIIAADVPEGKGPTGKASFLGTPFICRDIEHDPQMLPWRDKALRCGLRSAAAFPLRTSSAVIGAFTVYADSPYFFTHEETNLLASLADDISFAIDSLANEKRRLEVEKELRESQGSLAKAQSIAHLGSWSMDLKSRETVWSEELYRIFGVSPATFAGDVRNILSAIVHPDDRDNVLKRFDQIMQERVISPLEYRIVLPDGSLRVVRSEGEMVFDLSRKAVAAIGTVQDITERWETENRIKVTNSLLALYTQKTDRREYLDAAVLLILAWSGCHHCGVRIVKRDNTVPFESCANYTDAFLEKEASTSLAEGSCICNRVVAGIAEPQDLPAMTPQGSFYSNDTQQFFDRLSPAEKAKFSAHCLQSGFVSLAIIPIRHRKTMIGAIHLADDNSGMVPRQKVEFVEYLSHILGEAIYRFGIEDDLRKNYDALRESEARYRTLFQDVRDVIFTVTSDGFITSLNPAFETITGIPREEVVGQHFSRVIHPDDLAFATTILRKALDGEPIPLFELRTRTRAGEYRYLEFKITSERRDDESILGIARDVTERKKAERDLRLANAYNRSLLEASLDPLVTIGADGTITDVNMATEAATGLVRSELIGTDFSNYFTEPEKAQQGYQRVFREGKVMDYALEIRHRDGGVTPVLYNASLYRDENGNVLGVFAAARDVTELREGERRNTVINNLLQLFAQSYSRKDYMDQAVNVIRSWSRCESVGMRILDQEGNIPYVTCIGFDSNFVESESRISLTRDHCACTRVVAEQPDPLDASVMTANGSLFYNNAVKFVNDLPDEKKKHFRGVCQRSGFNSVAVIPLRYRNKVLGAIHLADARENMFPLPAVEFLERTALIIGEAIYRFGIEEEQVRLASALESSADAIIITDPEHGNIQYVNSAFESITGYTKNEALGRTMHFLESGRHPEEFYNELREALRREGLWRGQLLNRKKDGALYFEDCSISVVRDGTGQIINFVSVKRDVTEKLRLESIAESVNTMNNIGYVFSGVRHEIGNPINSAKMSLSVLQHKLNSVSKEVVRDYVDRALGEIGRVEHLLKSLRNYNLYETPELDNLDLSAFMDKFFDLISEDFAGKGIAIRRDIHPDAQWVTADPRALQQVLLNIMTNASDALSNRPSPAIAVTATKKGRRVTLEIRDNGSGMTEKQQQNMFKPFYTSKARGTGLGLVIVKKMLTKMNGDISIESRQDQGTTVTITLPEGASGTPR